MSFEDRQVKEFELTIVHLSRDDWKTHHSIPRMCFCSLFFSEYLNPSLGMKSSEAPLSYLQNTDRRTADNVNSLKHVGFKKCSGVSQKKPKKNHFYFFMEKMVIQIYIPISRGGFFSLSSALTHSSFTIKRVCHQYQQNRMK